MFGALCTEAHHATASSLPKAARPTETLRARKPAPAVIPPGTVSTENQAMALTSSNQESRLERRSLSSDDSTTVGRVTPPSLRAEQTVQAGGEGT